MPKQIPDTELEAIKRAVTGFPEGASIDDIRRALERPPSLETLPRTTLPGRTLPRRTLQRRLALLVARGQLRLEGSGRGSRYRLPAITATGSGQMEPLTGEAYGENYVPTSREGEKVKQIVRLPVHQRTPLGYNRDFLDTYQPNQTFYLPEQTRQHLLRIGQSRSDALPAGTYALQIYNRLLIDLTWNSSRLEGNTYSLLETERLLAGGDMADGKDALETQMILNHKAAIELLVNSASDVGFNSYTLCNLHALLSENLLSDPAACGRLREHSVGIGGSVFHPLQGGVLVRECFADVLRKASAIQNPFEQAFFAMVHLPYLQPFDDVNKRVSRLAANIPLIRENLSPLSFVDVPAKAYVEGLLGIYELNRSALLADVFTWAYERSCARYSAVRQSLGEPDPFRLRYRENIARLITAIVGACMDKKAAVSAIKEQAVNEIAEQDRDQFLEVMETELINLHAGNIARYRISRLQFARWHRTWR